VERKLDLVEIKNVILYDHYQHVVGFVELKNIDAVTHIKVKHNLQESDVIVSVQNGARPPFYKGGIDVTGGFSVSPPADLDDEVVICLVQKNGNTVTTLASGIINPNIVHEKPTLDACLPKGVACDSGVGYSPQPFSKSMANLPSIKSILKDTETPIDRTGAVKKTAAAREIDDILRAVCMVDSKGKGICQTCPYREFFFGENYNDENRVIELPCGH